MDTLISILVTYIVPAVAILIAALAILAPLTKSDLDNKFLAALRWFEQAVLKVLLPGREVSTSRASAQAKAEATLFGKGKDANRDELP